mgnify:CR=1 FL=1
MNTLVIGNVHPPQLITGYISYLNPIVSLTPDYAYHCIGHYRCFTGHTNALTAYMTDETALVFEDDAVPDSRHDWKRSIEAANALVLEERFEIVCLHGRGFDYQKFRKMEAHGFSWLIPTTEDRWVLGTLCYVISRKAAEKWIKEDFWLHGTNIDLFVWSNRFNFCMIDPTPFIHDRSQGSILENPKNTEVVVR